ncbi:MAG TPA: hypothetical protein VHM20_00775, partial [Gammaproteobacteria bacterium]|nr:hypothetical protein [Gammaproteobacteria bacterium]
RFASIREDYYETLPGLWFGSTRLDVDVVQIAFARNNPENLILVPSLGAYKEDGIRKIMALGTVESCFQIIKNNLCTDFCLEYNAHREKFVEQFHYRIFDSKKAKLLISALKQNETIEKINLMGVHISKDDFHGLIETLASKKSFKELNLGNAYFHFTNAEFETIQKSIKNFKVISGGASFLEGISELNKKETESKPMKKFGGHIRACMLDKADNLVSVNWHHTGFYSIKEKLIPYKFPFEKIIENSKELYEIYRAFEEINYHKVNIKNKKQYDDAYDDFSEIIQDVAERVPKQESTIELLGKEIEVLNKIKAIFSVNGINFELEEESIGLRFS